MDRVAKVPYYELTSSLFTGDKWRECSGWEGCVPLDSPTTISMERLAPGEPMPPAPPPPPPAPKLTAQQKKEQAAQQAREEARQRALAQQAAEAEKQRLAKEKAAGIKPTTPKAEKVEELPPFDLLDIPGAMDKMGWPVSAKLAREWISSPKHIFDDDPSSVQPLDDTTVTLDWCLKFEGAKKRYDALLSESVYSEHAIPAAVKLVKPSIEKTFRNTGSGNMIFDTASDLKDLRQFHLNWQFQHIKVSDYDTVKLHFSYKDFFEMNDLTASLANFGLYAAVGRFEVSGDKYYTSDNIKRIKTSCLDPKVKITHVYVYVKDNYSFNDSDGNSQYLGHWNKSGVILVKSALLSILVNHKWIHTHFGDSPDEEDSTSGQPVDARRGIIKTNRKQDVYYPVYNKTYNEWREKHNRGGDFMIYSKPILKKLSRPIEFSVETVCKDSEKM